MKKLNFLFALVMSSAAIAGGQDGSGGNACLSKKLQLISLEEAQHKLEVSTEIARPVFSSNVVDLMQTEAGQLALASIREYADHHADLSREMMTHFARFIDVEVRGYAIQGAREADSAGILEVCFPGSTQAVLFTTKKGRISVNRTSWNQMKVGSQQVLLVHETLRLLQMFTPMGEAMSNADLQLLTVAIIQGKPMSKALAKIFAP
jgi:hypothetical protein